MWRFRFHGRGGQGARIASRILGRSGFLSGLYAQDFALFGAERRGAPVAAFTRLDGAPIAERGYVEAPALAVVMDHTLLQDAADQVFHGVCAETAVIVNAGADQLPAFASDLPPANFFFIDLSAIARERLGNEFVSAAAAAAAAKCVAQIGVDTLCEAVRLEIAGAGLPPDIGEKNAAAARKAHARAPRIPLPAVPESNHASERGYQAVPYPRSARFTGPTITRRGSAALRRTGDWRIERPVLELGKCKRCFLCYLYCPEAAMTLDADNFPHVDYEHCKGCMICFEECPADAIRRSLEAA